MRFVFRTIRCSCYQSVVLSACVFMIVCMQFRYTIGWFDNCRNVRCVQVFQNKWIVKQVFSQFKQNKQFGMKFIRITASQPVPPLSLKSSLFSSGVRGVISAETTTEKKKNHVTEMSGYTILQTFKSLFSCWKPVHRAVYGRWSKAFHPSTIRGHKNLQKISYTSWTMIYEAKT